MLGTGLWVVSIPLEKPPKHERLPLETANPLSIESDLDGIEPGEELTLSVESLNALPCRYQRFLGQFLSQTRILCQDACLSKETCLKGLDEVAEGILITRLSSWQCCGTFTGLWLAIGRWMRCHYS